MSSRTFIVSLILGLAVYGVRGAIPSTRPSVIAHRGSSGRYPEHTVVAFESAVNEQADTIECDISITRDLVLICTHEPWLNDLTNIQDFYPDRMNSYIIDNENITDYFSVDFDWSELQLVKKRQRFDFRDPTLDDVYPIASFEEFIQIALNAGNPTGLLVEVKYPEWHNSLSIVQEAGTTIGDLVVEMLSTNQYVGPDSLANIQCFDETFLIDLRSRTQLPFTFLVRELSEVTDEKLAQYAEYGSGIGAEKGLIITIDNNRIVERSDLVDRAHGANLDVFAWTFRNEDQYLAWDYGQDPWMEYYEFLQLEVDGFITDFPETTVRFLDSVYDCDVGSGQGRNSYTSITVLPIVLSGFFLKFL